jgi:thioester reductase-like protein
MIESLVTNYTADLPVRELDVQNISNAHTVILTGSTGSLGTYILVALLRDSTTAKVYCLNRSGDAESQQKEGFVVKGLAWDADREEKVEFLQASFGAEKFGLEDGKYEEMLCTVDTIIHNAWKVDFNHSVSSFESTHIRGVRRFANFSLQSAHHAHIHFISSVAAVGSWNHLYGSTIAEEVLENANVTLAQGYGESKNVGERICSTASRRARVPTTIHRVGQVGGPTLEKGAWNRQEWLPTIIATSKSTGRIPDDLGRSIYNWIPVVSCPLHLDRAECRLSKFIQTQDTLATILIDLIETRRRTQLERRCAVFNLVNATASSWKSLIPVIQRHYRVETVSLAT